MQLMTNLNTPRDAVSDRAPLTVELIMVDLVALLLLLYPVLMLGSGIESYGAAAGWWPGDNEGEAEIFIGIALGALCVAIVLIGATIVVAIRTRLFHPRPPITVLNTSGLLLTVVGALLLFRLA